MADGTSNRQARRLLDPIDRISEVLFGLIMALSFTCSLSAAEAGRDDVQTMLVGAIGCNVAWGLIDAIIFLMTSLTERARGFATLRAVRRSKDPAAARAIIADALPPLVAANLGEESIESLRVKLGQMAAPPERPRLGRDDFLAALGVFLLVFLATFPVVVPFIFMDHTLSALRVSNGIALVMLFLAGYAFGSYARHRPWRMGLTMMVIGSLLVGITIALGG